MPPIGEITKFAGPLVEQGLELGSKIVPERFAEIFAKLSGRGSREADLAAGGYTSLLGDSAKAGLAAPDTSNLLGKFALDSAGKREFAPVRPEQVGSSFSRLTDQMAARNITEAQILGSKRHENLYGTGKYSLIYRIDGTEDFLFKFAQRFKTGDKFRAPTVSPLQAVDNPVPINVGQEVASLGDHRVILPVNGIPGGGPRKWAIESMGSEEAAQAHDVHLQRTAALPLESYVELGRKFKLLEKSGYEFDNIPSDNLLYDLRNREINVVDVAPNSHYRASFEDIARPTMDIYFRESTYPSHFGRLADTPSQLANLRTIFEKSEQAALANGLNRNGYDAIRAQFRF